MNDSLIATRYAKAFYQIVKERGIAEETYKAMNCLTVSFEGASGNDLKIAISNPYVDSAQKRGLILTAAGIKEGNPCRSSFEDFLTLLFRNNRIGEFKAIVYAFDALYRKENNIKRVKVTWASQPTGESESRLKEMISQRLANQTMEYTSEIDPSLIGGFKIAIDNDQLDASVANELRQLRQQILSK